MKRSIWAVLSAFFALGLWQVIIVITSVPHFILPSPLRVATTLFDSRSLIAEHAVITFVEVLVGIVLGSLLGACTALWLVVSPATRRLIMPLLIFTQAVPVFALAPVLTLWFGYGIWSKIIITVLIIYFPVASTFLDGLQHTNQGYLDLARSMNARADKILLKIRFPAALPSFGSGLKLAAVYSPIGAVIGEWVGASGGLGYLMLLANGRAKTDLMFASLLVLALFTIALYSLVALLEAYLTQRTHRTSSPSQHSYAVPRSHRDGHQG